MSIFDLFKKHEERSAGTDISWSHAPLGQTTNWYTGVRPEVAESLSTVYACVQAIASAISALPVRVYRNEGRARHEVLDGPIPALLRRGPNPYQSTPEFLEMLVAQVLLRGNGLVEIRSNSRGEVEGLIVLPWSQVSVQMLPNGKLVYDIYPSTDVWSGTQVKHRRLLADDCIHIRDRSDDGVVGKSRLQRAGQVIRDALTVSEFAISSFAQGLRPGGVLRTDGKLSAETRERLVEQLRQNYAGAKGAGKALVLENGLQYQQLTAISPEDAELLESRKWTTEELCRIFAVPPPIIQDYAHNTFTNSEQAGRWFAQFCLLPLVRKIECSFNASLWPDGNFEVDLDMTAFDRGDPSTRWQNHKIAIDTGILTIDEIREAEGFSPLEKKI